jgi:transcriptional regulator with XRE-family HTH domain
MDVDLSSMIKAAKLSQAEVARRVGVRPPVLNRWCKDHRSVPDDKAIRLAEILRKTPFDINPDFNKTVFDGIRDVDERDETRLRMKRAFRYQIDRDPAVGAPAERPRKVRTE